METPPTRHRGRPLTTETPLSEREQAFIAEYLLDFNATRSARAVGFVGENVGVTAHKVLSRPHVQEAIREAMAERTARLGVTADRVVQDIDAAANLDIGELFTADGRLRKVHEMPAHVRRCIVSIKVVKKNLTTGDGIMDDVHEVKLIDKGKMHEILAKYTGVTREDAQQPVANVPAFTLPPETPGVSVH